jgi:hypothetical protein
MSEYDNSNNEIILDENKETDIKFWGENPNVFLVGAYLHELFPTEEMSHNQKLNSITRLIFIISLFMLILTKRTTIILVLLITLGFIYAYHYHYNKVIQENFSDQANEVIEEHNVNTDNVFDEPTSSNPFSNVLISDISLNPDKKAAPPAFSDITNEKIMDNSKKMIQELNPDHPNINDKLFKDLGEQYTFEQSLRQFNSNPNTQIVNDQTGFAEFCYGNMVSCKEGNLFACARNKTNYNLY